MAASSPFVITIPAKNSPSSYRLRPSNKLLPPQSGSDPPRPLQYRHHHHCLCGRRHLIGSSLLPILTHNPNSKADTSPLDSEDLINKFHPKRPDWYRELYARILDQGMKSYEAQVAEYKKEVFSDLAGMKGSMKNIAELGVGAGPNFKYYAGSDLNVIGVDPTQNMEKYARAAAVAAGLPPENFNFMRGVGEALPLGDNSMDVVIGTLVLCSVKDVDMALKEVKRVLKQGGIYIFIEHVAANDGSFYRLMQNVLDPLQQFVADGCHLNRETGKQIYEAGFSSVNLNSTFLSNVPLCSPHVYGTACK